MNLTKTVLPNESDTKALGQQGERLAANFLERKGFRLVAANFVAPVGRNRRGAQILAEVDLIAYDDETLVFIEVKTRRSDEFVSPETAVNLRKQRQITRVARVYQKIFALKQMAVRFDVVSVVLADNRKPHIEHFDNFWTAAKFRKANWTNTISAS